MKVDTDASRLPYLQLITDRTFLENILMYWTSYWVFSVIFTCVLSYMGQVVHYNTTESCCMFMLFIVFNIPLVLGGFGWFLVAQCLLKKGVASRYARGWLTSLCVMLGGGLILFVVLVMLDSLSKVIVLAIGCNLTQITFVLSSTIAAEIMPAAQRSSMMSIKSALATTDGLLAPALMGALFQQAATPALGYDTGFLVAGLLCLVTSVIGFSFIHPASS